MKTKILLILGVIAASLFLISCGSVGSSVPNELACTQDSDCVAAQCCHADSAVNKDYVLDCSGMLCTADCQPGTMDCGQAVAKCVEGACAVVEI